MREREVFALLLLGCIFCGSLVVAAVLASKILQFGPFYAPAGVLAYCFTFICTDVVSEIWGKRHANAVVLAGFISLAFAMLLTQLALIWPAADFWANKSAFDSILGMTPRIIIASLVAYALSQYHDIWLFHLIKKRTAGRHLWLRNTSSTIISQLIDSTVFISIAFYGILPLWPLIFGQWLVKVGIALCDTPLVYGAVWFLRRKLPELPEQE